MKICSGQLSKKIPCGLLYFIFQETNIIGMTCAFLSFYHYFVEISTFLLIILTGCKNYLKILIFLVSKFLFLHYRSAIFYYSYKDQATEAQFVQVNKTKQQYVSL